MQAAWLRRRLHTWLLHSASVLSRLLVAMRLLPSARQGYRNHFEMRGAACRLGRRSGPPGDYIPLQHAFPAGWQAVQAVRDPPNRPQAAPVSARTRVAARLLVWAANFWKRIASLGAVLTNSATPQTRTHRTLPLLTHCVDDCSATLPLVLLKLLLMVLGADREAMLLKAVVKWGKGNSCGRPASQRRGYCWSSSRLRHCCL